MPGNKDQFSSQPSFAHFSPLHLFQGTVGEVLGNVDTTQNLLDTNTTQIVQSVSRATSHMSMKKTCSMWSVNACGQSLIQPEGGEGEVLGLNEYGCDACS